MNPAAESSRLRFASALSTRPNLPAAIDEASEVVRSTLEGDADFAIVFASPDYAEWWDDLPVAIAERLGTERILGCSGAGIIGTRREVEEGPALSIWAARGSEVDLIPVQLSFQRTHEGGAIVGWPDKLVSAWPEDATFLLLAEPFSFPADYLLQQLNDDHPRTPVIGGMASGGSTPGQNRLFFGTQSLQTGAVGWVMSGALHIRSLVSQGCRPIGEKLIVTAAERNLIQQLGGKPALAQLQAIFQQLPTHEQELLQRGLHLGRVVSEYQDEYAMGDFLVRNVLGIDHESGAIAVGDYIRPGQTVQFHLREEHAASAELKQLLGQLAHDRRPEAGLLFTCNGRGTHLFSQPHHDAEMVAQLLGDIPLAGFFAQGEIGPVGGASFLHGFTASLALFG